jgi:hypothetical protein
MSDAVRATPRPRTRPTRGLDLGEQTTSNTTQGAAEAVNTETGAPTPDAIEQAKNWVRANNDKNAKAREEKAAEKALTAEIVEHQIADFVVDVDGTNYRVGTDNVQSVSIDMVELRKITNDEQFMQIVGATQANVKAVLGEAGLQRVLKRGAVTTKVTKKKL